jgi:hypothetical protein
MATPAYLRFTPGSPCGTGRRPRPCCSSSLADRETGLRRREFRRGETVEQPGQQLRASGRRTRRLDAQELHGPAVRTLPVVVQHILCVPSLLVPVLKNRIAQMKREIFINETM